MTKLVALSATAVMLMCGTASAQLPSLDIRQELPAVQAPELTVLGPSAVQAPELTVLGPSTAILQAGIDPNALPGTVYVEYGTTTALGQSTPAVSLAAGANVQQLLTELTQLKPGTTYYYRVVVQNSSGTTTGPTQTFQTPGATRVDPDTGKPTSGSDGVSCTITGTNRANRLKGTRGRDVICGLGGNDRISGSGGNDTILGGSGNDRIDGGSGHDRILGNSGRDGIVGASGNDRLDGGSGNDALVGKSGRDRLAGGSGNDRLISSVDRRGGDRVNGGKGRDSASVNRGDRAAKVERVNGRKAKRRSKR